MGSAERALRRKQEQKLEKQTRPQDKALEDFLNAIAQFVFMGVPREMALKMFEAAWTDVENAQSDNPKARVKLEVDRLSRTGSWWGGE